MSTAPSGWQNPKTNWASADVPLPTDFNRIESNLQAIELGQRTLDPTQVPSGNQGTLRQMLDWFANRIRAITGGTNWWDAPATTLDALAGVRIVEMGSNSNGEYVRWENGLQACWFANDPTPNFTARTEGAVSGYTHSDDWTYPAAFIANPSVAVIGGGYAGGQIQTSLNASIVTLSTSTTRVAIRLWAWNQVNADVKICRIAIGRWK